MTIANVTFILKNTPTCKATTVSSGSIAVVPEVGDGVCFGDEHIYRVRHRYFEYPSNRLEHGSGTVKIDVYLEETK